jgi:hypothetical protein
MGFLSGKTTAEGTKGLSFITGYNKAEFGNIRMQNTVNGDAPMLDIYVYDQSGTKKEKPESLFLCTKEGALNIDIINMIIKAYDPSAEELPVGYAFTEEDEKLLASLAGQPVALLMYRKESVKEAGKFYHNTNSYGFKGNIPVLVHSSRIGEEVDVADETAKTGKTTSQTNAANGNSVLR